MGPGAAPPGWPPGHLPWRARSPQHGAVRSFVCVTAAVALAVLLGGCAADEGGEAGAGGVVAAGGASSSSGGMTPADAGRGGGTLAGAGDGGGGAGASAGSPGLGSGGTFPSGGRTGTGGAVVGGAVSAGATAAGAAGGAGGAVPAAGEPDCRRDGDGWTTLAFVNRCGSAVTFAGSDLEGGPLAPGAFACVDIGTDVEELSSKRYWGFVGEDPGAERHTLAEFTFNTDFYDFDWYNISHVDAHNLPMSIVPVARPDCHVLSCPQDFLAPCPELGQVRDAGGAVVACVSPDRDDPTGPVVLLFEQCDDAYAWSGDDAQGEDVSPMRACAGEDWDIVFCPGAGA